MPAAVWPKPDLGGKLMVPENAVIFSISLLGEEIYRMYWMIPRDVTTSRTRLYKRRQLKAGMPLEFRLQRELKRRGHGGLVVRSRLWGWRVLGSKPLKIRRVLGLLHVESYAGGQTYSRWCGAEVWREGAILII
ncbi:hypothetical protein AVEN_70063-1 [Araneus ventricosus]|uniref:Uncharacterized protein n=1 Tax=Araneus ventricosus TaxID=182803 RepID=A0A4Y2NLP4_ARAVE|nr:hypothetical protein AVEN_70063-1 [Araneus ventricosus]